MIEQFPEKLSLQEEHSIASKIQASKGADEDSVNLLVMHNMREALIYSRAVTHGNLEDSELISVAYSALFRNAKRYQPGGLRFFAFAKPGVRGAFSRNWQTKDTVKNAKTVSRETIPSLVEHRSSTQRNENNRHGIREEGMPISEEEMDRLAKLHPVPESEVVQPDFATVFHNERWELVKGVIDAKLNEQEKMVMNLAFRSGLNFAEIGKMLGVSRAAVQGVSSRALKKIRCELLRRKRFFE